MSVTRKKHQKRKPKLERGGRTKDGPVLIVDLAHFLNLDIATCEIQNRWHYFESWPRLGIATGATDADLKRYAELKLLVTLLDERDIQPGRADLIVHLQNLQDEIKQTLRPILRSSVKAKEQNEINYGMRYGLESLVARINQCDFRSRWALYSENVGDRTNLLKGWHCTYDPERPNNVTSVDGNILAQERVLHLADYRFVVTEIPPRSNSIADRLYWIIGQTLINATISRLKRCVECGKYFSAYDSKQIVCGSTECRIRHNRKGMAKRVRDHRKRRAEQSRK